MPTDLVPVAELPWEFLTDAVMGGLSEGRMSLEDGILRLAGTVSTANRGGFIQARTRLRAAPGPGAAGLCLRVRGNGERYALHLRTGATRRPWHVYRAGFDTGPDWREVRVPFAAFRPSGEGLTAALEPSDIRSVGLVAWGREHAADVSLSVLGFY